MDIFSTSKKDQAFFVKKVVITQSDAWLAFNVLLKPIKVAELVKYVIWLIKLHKA